MHRLLLVGGGHAMLPALQAAAAWTRAGHAVTLLSDHPYLYYSGMVPEYLGGVYRREEVRIDLAAHCRRAGVTFVEDRATGLDPARRTVRTLAGRVLPCDVAAFDVGAVNPGPPGPAPASLIDTKPLHHVERLASFLEALLAGRAAASLLIVGGGAAGVEVALNLTGRVGARRPGALEITVVEGGPRLLPAFPEGMSTYLTGVLRRRGVRLRCGVRVEAVHPEGVTLDTGETLRADRLLWSTGSAGQPLFREAGLPCDDRGFLRVDRTLRCPGHPWLFAAGDCAVVEGLEHLPRVGVHAVKQGPVLARNLEAALRGASDRSEALQTFAPYPAAPLILSTGAPEAVWTVGPVWLRGKPFLRLKHFLDQRWIRQYSPAVWGGHPTRKMFDAASASLRSTADTA